MSYNQYNGYEEKPRRNGSLAWLWATLILVAFVGGIFLSQLILPGGILNQMVMSQPTATPTPEATPQATPQSTPEATPEPTPDATATPGNNDLGNIVPLIGDFSSVIERVSPAVVGVSNRVAGASRFGDLQDETEQGYGSGVIISSDGYIVTNNHVIAGADSITVILQGGEEVAAELVGSDSLSDLAVLKINKTGLAALPLGNSDEVKVGQWAIAIGNPLGQQYADTTTFGIVSGVNREVTSNGFTRYMIQTDAAINPGNSGGALINAKGELIGINTLKSQYVDSTGYSYTTELAEGIGLAIPSNEVREVIEEIMENGLVARPFLGVANLQDVDQYTARYNRVPVGVLVRDVTENGPAAKAGIKPNDIITDADGLIITSSDDLRTVINGAKIGDTIKIKVYRYEESKELEMEVVLGSTADYQ